MVVGLDVGSNFGPYAPILPTSRLRARRRRDTERLAGQQEQVMSGQDQPHESTREDEDDPRRRPGRLEALEELARIAREDRRDQDRNDRSRRT